jgi:hypothetical protein
MRTVPLAHPDFEHVAQAAIAEMRRVAALVGTHEIECAIAVEIREREAVDGFDDHVAAREIGRQRIRAGQADLHAHPVAVAIGHDPALDAVGDEIETAVAVEIGELREAPCTGSPMKLPEPPETRATSVKCEAPSLR